MKSVISSNNMLLVLALLCSLAMFIDPSYASTSGGSNMPWSTGLNNLRESITGPVATGIALIGIVASGAMLVFGAEISGVLKSVLILVLVISIIISASSMLDMIGGSSQVISDLDNLSASELAELAKL